MVNPNCDGHVRVSSITPYMRANSSRATSGSRSTSVGDKTSTPIPARGRIAWTAWRISDTEIGSRGS
eukprot:977988-Pyramimonas_sp.AAC.1